MSVSFFPLLVVAWRLGPGSHVRSYCLHVLQSNNPDHNMGRSCHTFFHGYLGVRKDPYIRQMSSCFSDTFSFLRVDFFSHHVSCTYAKKIEEGRASAQTATWNFINMYSYIIPLCDGSGKDWCEFSFWHVREKVWRSFDNTICAFRISILWSVPGCKDEQTGVLNLFFIFV